MFVDCPALVVNSGVTLPIEGSDHQGFIVCLNVCQTGHLLFSKRFIIVVMGIILAYARPFPIPGLRSFILYDNDLDGLVEYYYCPYLYDCNRWGYSQPSYSSTLLLLIFTNDMLEDLSSESSLYADESSLIKILHLQTIAAWAGTVEVNFKASKTVYMIVSKKCVVQNTFRCILTVNYFNVQCYCCRSGLWISEKMSWGYTSP